MQQYPPPPGPSGPVPAGTPLTPPAWQGPYGATPPLGAVPFASTASTRWRALRTVSAVYKVLAWIVLVVGTIGSLVAAVAVSQFNGGFGLLTALFYLIGVAIAFIGIYAFGELIELFIAIEENTRKS